MSPTEGNAKAAIYQLRSDEAPLGELTWSEEGWLAVAMAHLMQIYQKRAAGQPNKHCFCVFSFPGNIFVQFLAHFDAERLSCEVVSAQFSGAAASLTLYRESLLRDFGFDPPGLSPNYSQEVDIRSVADLGYAIRLAFRVLKQVYLVNNFELGTFKLNVPGEKS